MGVCADDLGGAMSFGFNLAQTDRIRCRSSGVLGGEFADELVVCRDSRSVTCGMCLNADDLSLALPLGELVGTIVNERVRPWDIWCSGAVLKRTTESLGRCE